MLKGFDTCKVSVGEGLQAIEEAEKNIPSNMKTIQVIYSITSGYRMISFILAPHKSKREVNRKGYYLAYVYNVDSPELSELGEIYVMIDELGNPVRQG